MVQVCGFPLALVHMYIGLPCPLSEFRMASFAAIDTCSGYDVGGLSQPLLAPGNLQKAADALDEYANILLRNSMSQREAAMSALQSRVTTPNTDQPLYHPRPQATPSCRCTGDTVMREAHPPGLLLVRNNMLPLSLTGPSHQVYSGIDPFLVLSTTPAHELMAEHVSGSRTFRILVPKASVMPAALAASASSPCVPSRVPIPSSQRSTCIGPK